MTYTETNISQMKQTILYECIRGMFYFYYPPFGMIYELKISVFKVRMLAKTVIYTSTPVDIETIDI